MNMGFLCKLKSVIALCLVMVMLFSGCAPSVMMAVPATSVDEQSPESDAPQLGQEQDELIFVPMRAQAGGVAGLDPTGEIMLTGLQTAADMRMAEIAPEQEEESGDAVPATASFNASSAGSFSANIRSWQSTNSDIKGWVYVPGTNINYPVAHHSDINYYLARGYYKEPSTNGVIWTNGSTSFGNSSQISNNTVLYGHNWTNVSANPSVGSGGVMFAQLPGYHYLSTAQANPYIYYSTASQDMVFKIFAVFYTDLSFNYISSSGGQYIIDEARRRSRHNFDVDVSSSDKILTLSTCTRAYGATSNQRFVVMARLLRPGETVSPYTITSNPGHKQPSVW